MDKPKCFFDQLVAKPKKFTANIWLKWNKFGMEAKVGGQGV